jgi:DNA-binding Lrp family transcriptional regulator
MTDEVEDHSGSEESISEDTGKPKQKRLGPEEWREIEMLYEYGLMKTKALADKFGVTPSAIHGHFQELKKKGIIIAPGAKKAEAYKALKMAIAPPAAPPKPQSDFEIKRKERIEGAKERRYLQAAFHNQQVMTVQKAIQDGSITWVAAHSQIKAMQRMGKTILDAQAMFENALNIAGDIDEASMTILEFRDLTSDEIVEIQQGSDDDGLDGLEMPELEEEDEDIVEQGSPTP